MKSFLVVIALFCMLTSCVLPDSFRYYSLFLEVQDSNLLKAGDPILAKGSQVGRVHQIIDAKNEKPLVELFILNDFMVPMGSELRIVTDIDNASAFLEIQVSHSKRNYAKEDTVKAFATVLLNNDVILEEIEVDPDTMEAGIRHLLQ
jgi:ABC-type transporter Mla subunit MlaD